MNDKSIWKLSDEDFAVIEELFEKKMALENLAKVVQADNEALYEKLLKDYAHVSADYTAWWANQSQKYGWEGSNWWLNFDTREIMQRQ